ncbi:DNA-3-methyladenine glycosylase I [Hyphomicrobium methylovorum]|uniref:DNA-3-methyladenine glycosylase I n=1 Tax=Hyphomicrobium methylovorum TaxID=84 RepID=UPI0015E798DE|nr:DNA-3-methyladenine glycosylase I [Hyphomicrobium methylovorum]MBA2127280.1 DNA-3-methyladenine glycosylase I [Hyphomicrobium methylovorum]
MSKTTKLVRCSWAGEDATEYARYHDEEWGVPMTDPRALFEKLSLEGFQAGLSWLTILRKRENFRKAFHNFDPERVARMNANDVERLMANEGIIRNRAKIEASISNAKAYLALSEKTPFAKFLWSFVDGRPVINERTTLQGVETETEASKRMSKALKAAGFRFVGATTLYAFMQSTGMVNDHLVTCFRHKPCAALQKKFRIENL